VGKKEDMKALSKFSVNYPITIIMIVLAIVLLGYISFTNLSVDLFPDLNNPRIYVEIEAGERPPEEMEEQFVENIEALAIRQKKVLDVSSVSKVGTAQITVEYSWDTDMDESFLDLQKSLTNFAQNSDIEQINITQHDPNSSPVMIIGFSHVEINDMDELRKVAENYLQNELTRLEGIAAVELIGAEEKEVVVKTSPYLMDAHGLDMDAIAARIQSSNVTASGGSIVELSLKYVIRGIGEFSDLDDIKYVIVGERPAVGNESELVPVFLKDIADITFQNKEPENIVRVDGRRSIALAIYKETRFNTVKAVEILTENLVQLQKALPGYEFVILQNQATFIDNAIVEVEQTALIGILLAISILYIFLRRIGTTAIISIAIPISVIATFNLMYFNGLTLNIMTLGGLALGAGMLVDNAIVVMENIFRNLETGLPLKEAAIQGTSQVSGAITASTITTIVVFLPIVYLHGAAGELFKDQAWTVAFSLVSSLIVAIFVIPMLSHKLLKPQKHVIQSTSSQFNWYPELLNIFISNRWKIIGGAGLLIFIAFLMLQFIGSEFMPQSESDIFKIEIVLEEGTSLEHMDQVVLQTESSVRDLIGSDIDRIYTRVGPLPESLGEQGVNELQESNIAVLTVYLSENSEKKSSDMLALFGNIFQNADDRQYRFYQEQSSLQNILGTDQAPLVVEIKGEDLNTIRSLTNEVKLVLENFKNIINVKSSFDQGHPEVNIVFDRIRAGVYNLDFAVIGSQLRDQLQGKNVGNWDSEGEMRDITVKLPDVPLAQLSTMYIYDGQRKIRLDEIARFEETIGAKEINRRNQVRTGLVFGQIEGDEPLDKIAVQIRDQVEKIDIPPNYKIEITGQEMKRQQSFSNLKFALLLSIILIYMVMASQFESLIHPFTILLTIPLAAVGSVILFFVMQLSFNVMAYIGMIMLVGIAVNDSIILVDAINQLKREGLTRHEAIFEAGKRRIRPIIMTSRTTILALFPLTIGFGESVALRSPMALAVIGGLVTSTVLTLVVIPCVYDVLDQIKEKIKIF
jgi:HAE1 family hydrophobic/amphiphilic exporter-1